MWLQELTLSDMYKWSIQAAHITAHWLLWLLHCSHYMYAFKKLSDRRPHAVSVEILSVAAQLYEISHIKTLAIGEWPWRSLKIIELPLFHRPYVTSCYWFVVTTSVLHPPCLRYHVYSVHNCLWRRGPSVSIRVEITIYKLCALSNSCVNIS